MSLEWPTWTPTNRIRPLSQFVNPLNREYSSFVSEKDEEHDKSSEVNIFDELL